MKAKVKLLLKKAVEPTDIEAVRHIAGSMTPDKRTISIRIQSENINLLEATFERFPGRQVDVLDSIFKPFRLHISNSHFAEQLAAEMRRHGGFLGDIQ